MTEPFTSLLGLGALLLWLSDLCALLNWNVITLRRVGKELNLKLWVVRK